MHLLSSLLLLVCSLAAAASCSTVPGNSRVHKMVAFHRLLKKSFHIMSRQSIKSTKASSPEAKTHYGKLCHLAGMSEDEECMADLVFCQANMETCEEKASVPKLLFVQMTNACTLTKSTDEEGDTTYDLFSSNDMDEETYAFTGCPFEIAGTIATEEFFKNFTKVFTQDTGGNPNVAFTFSHANTTEFQGPIIAEQVDAMHEEDGMYSYVLEQSKSQAEVVALSAFFDSGVGADGEVVFDDCSLSINSSASIDCCFPS